MGNEGLQPPPPQQEQPGQQKPYYGWQYDQDQPDRIGPQQQAPVAPQQPNYSPQQQYPINSQQVQGMPPQIPQQYQQPVQDMGTSLGYGQGMEYQYVNTPQPSQPLPQLRQARLQQLREDRMRRQQRRIQTESPGFFIRKSVKQPSNVMPSPTINPPASAWNQSNVSQAPGSTQMSPGMSVSPVEVSPVPPSRLPPIIQRSPSGLPARKDDPHPPASEPAQDTGTLQKARIGRATLILTGSFIASRILGLLRTSLFAYVFGASSTSDAFLQAFLVPDLIFTVIAGGALSSAFIPVFTQYMVGDHDEKTAWHITSSLLNLIVVIMTGIALLAFIFDPWIVPLYNPGLSQSNPQELSLIISLSRIMLLQSVIMGGGVIINSVLFAKQNFLLPAIGTVLYNVGLIAGLIPGLLITAHRTPASLTLAAYLATLGVVFGAILMVGVQVPGVIKAGMVYTFSFDWRHPAVIQIARQMVPRAFNSAMLYFSIFVDRALILLMAAAVGLDAGGSITQYYQAFLLISLPLGVFGMAVSTAAFPTLAENVTLGRMDRFRNIIQDTLRTILFLSLPSSVGLIVLGLPIIQVLLEHGAYSLDSALSTSVPLAFFSVGLIGLSMVEILTRSFYALRDTKTPVTVSIVQFIFKIALSIILIQAYRWGLKWGLGGLALSTAIAANLEAFALLWLLQDYVEGFEIRKLALFAGRVLLAALAMGLALLIVRFLLDHIFVTTSDQRLGFGGTFLAIIKLSIELAVGLIFYIRATRLLGIEDFWKQGPIKRVLERLKLSWI
ncbi:MAG: murein biosynthesis integral membrane protein MurJ [Ktedonobacteraceae bacterium]